MIRDEFRDSNLDVSGSGGGDTPLRAANFLCCGARTVQIYTLVHKHGYDAVRELSDGMLAYMEERGIETVDQMVGTSLSSFDGDYEEILGWNQAHEAARRAGTLPTS